MKDIDKIVTIAQTYSYMIGVFTTDQLYDFLISHNFKFHTTGFDKRKIGGLLATSTKFDKIKQKNNISYFKAI